MHFNWDDALKFQGDTGPYLQYAYARLSSIEQKATTSRPELASQEPDYEQLTEDEANALVIAIDEFEQELDKARQNNEPAVLAHYTLEFATNCKELTDHSM